MDFISKTRQCQSSKKVRVPLCRQGAGVEINRTEELSTFSHPCELQGVDLGMFRKSKTTYSLCENVL